jgi:hypothetical protein
MLVCGSMTRNAQAKSHFTWLFHVYRAMKRNVYPRMCLHDVPKPHIRLPIVVWRSILSKTTGRGMPGLSTLPSKTGAVLDYCLKIRS